MSVRRVMWLLTAGYWAVLFVLTHLPPTRMMHGPSNDKLQHFAAYFVLSMALGTTMWVATPARRRVAPLVALGVCAAYGIFDELTQPIVGRSAEVGDWVADVSGATVAALILFGAQALSTRRPRPELAAQA